MPEPKGRVRNPVRPAAGRNRFFSPAVWPLLLITLLFVLCPLVYVVGISFLEKGDIWGVTSQLTIGNYTKMFDPLYADVFVGSFALGLLTTLLTLLIGYPFSYCVARMDPKKRQPVLLLMMAPFWLNSLLRLYGWAIFLRADGIANTLIQALGISTEPVKLLYTFGSTLIGMVYMLLPFMILATYNSLEKMDWSLVEAARDLGASPRRAFFTVTLPQTVPGIIAGTVLVFVPSVGMFFISDVLGGSKDMLLGSLIKNQLLTARNWPFGAALSVVMLVIMLLLLRVYKKTTGKGLGELM